MCGHYHVSHDKGFRTSSTSSTSGTRSLFSQGYCSLNYVRRLITPPFYPSGHADILSWTHAAKLSLYGWDHIISSLGGFSIHAIWSNIHINNQNGTASSYAPTMVQQKQLFCTQLAKITLFLSLSPPSSFSLINISCDISCSWESQDSKTVLTRTSVHLKW